MAVFKSCSPTTVSPNTFIKKANSFVQRSSDKVYKISSIAADSYRLYNTNVNSYYPLEASEVRKVITNKINNKPYNEEQFLYYHLNRNFFNVKNEITTLKKIENGIYVDNMNNIWTEVDVRKNFFHMPTSNFLGTILKEKIPEIQKVIDIEPIYSRKFLRDDTISGIGGEFEMIIRHDGKRIDATVDPKYQETYNYGRTKNAEIHTILDVITHTVNPNYSFRKDMGSVKIIE
ncbi:hypothetical protein [uncultured Spirosoma sp.]|uniref:hypothetical protein n=1 Tax=uncultured Spirosoma sp. TaxID=278208 RepID=UPI002587FC6C|nr:hypothetical protein [uncultured Spirosoma sp.]